MTKKMELKLLEQIQHYFPKAESNHDCREQYYDVCFRLDVDSEHYEWALWLDYSPNKDYFVQALGRDDIGHHCDTLEEAMAVVVSWKLEYGI